MILQLYINNSLHNELSIEPEEFLSSRRMNFENRVKDREERIQSYIKFMKATYLRAIAKSDTWYFVLVVRSRKFNVEENRYGGHVKVVTV